MKYFDSHIHITEPSLEGIEALLKHMDDQKNMVGGVLILNTMEEVEVVSMNLNKIPDNLVIVPYYNMPDNYPERIKQSKWVKIHSRISRLTVSDIPGVISLLKSKGDSIAGFIVDSFPWGTGIEYNISLPLTIKLATEFPDKSVLVAHGGGYESWQFRAHAGGLKNVFFDFAISTKYYEDTEYMKPLAKYLKHSPERVVFGTDWPFGEAKQHIKEYQKMADIALMKQEDLERIMLENSRKLWNLK